MRQKENVAAAVTEFMIEPMESDCPIICSYLFGFAGSVFDCDSLSVLLSNCIVYVDACGRNKPVHKVN